MTVPPLASFIRGDDPARIAVDGPFCRVVGAAARRLTPPALSHEVNPAAAGLPWGGKA
jgi:hypothetical protein